MIKTLLSVAALCATTLSYAQFATTGGNTGLTYSGSQTETATVASWITQVPESSDLNCTTAATGTVSVTGGEELQVSFANAESGYAVFEGDCEPSSPLFGVRMDNPLDLSATTNRKLSIAIKSDVSFLLFVNFSQL